MVMATDHVDLYKNMIENNKTYGLMVISFLATGRKLEDKDYEPYPEAIYAHENTFKDNGKDPAGPRAQALMAVLGKPMPEIIYDGILNPKRLVDGKVPDDMRVVFKDNGPVSVVNIHQDKMDPMNIAAHKDKVERNPKNLEGELKPLPPVKLPEVK
jgi:hypothetical protein